MSSADKRRNSAERKAKCSINNSGAKALYSFSKAQRFPMRMYRSVTDIRFYDTQLKKYDKKVSFTTSKRTSFWKDNGVPGPTKYSLRDSSFSEKNVGVQFKCGRDECKANSVFQENSNPGPGKYDPEDKAKYKSLCYSLRKKCEGGQSRRIETPGPHYNIESTLLDQNKYLSIYVRRSSTKICQPRTVFSRNVKKRDNTQAFNTNTSDNKANETQTSFITYKGGRAVGKSGPFPIQSHSKRLFQIKQKQEIPGPGKYQSFSQFPDPNAEIC